MIDEREIQIRIDELIAMAQDDGELDEGEQGELMALLWVMGKEDRWYNYLRTGSF